MRQYQDLNVSRMAQELQRFADERNWRQFHTPKNLAIALSVEASELLEVFQWMAPEESEVAHLPAVVRQHVGEEIADVLIYLVRLSDLLGIDLQSAYEHKLQINAEKYPVKDTRYREVSLRDSLAPADGPHGAGN